MTDTRTTSEAEWSSDINGAFKYVTKFAANGANEYVQEIANQLYYAAGNPVREDLVAVATNNWWRTDGWHFLYEAQQIVGKRLEAEAIARKQLATQDQDAALAQALLALSAAYGCETNKGNDARTAAYKLLEKYL